MSWVLAIDFGTSNTTAAFADDGAAPAVLEVEHSRYLPSVVVADADGNLLTGQAAARQALLFPERTERVPKRALVNGGDVLLAGAAVSAVTLVAAVLRRVFAEAVRFHGGQAPEAVILTHPARWGAPLVERLGAAAELAGIGRPLQVLLSEPEAAAWFYAPPSTGQVVAVFDLGGGTLDTAVLRATDGGFTLAGPPGGDGELGGEDFDEALLAWVGQQAAERDPAAWDELAGSGRRATRDRARLRAEVTAAKEALSQHTGYAVVVDGFDEEFRVTRGELDKLIGDTIARAAGEMKRTVAAAGVPADQLAGLYLTGGASRVPLIARQLWDALGVEPRLRDDPKAVVALGALRAHQAQPAGPVRDDPAPRSAVAVPHDLARGPAPVTFRWARTLEGRSGTGANGDIGLARVAWSPDGSHLAVACHQTLELWNVAAGRKVKTFAWRIWSPLSAVAWSPDSRQVVSAQSGSGSVKIWATDGSKRQLDVPGITDARSLAWNAAGDLIAVGGTPGDICVIDAASGRPRASYHPAQATVPKQPFPWSPPLAWQPEPDGDGELLAFAPADGRVRGLAPGDGGVRELLVLGSPVRALAWSPDGTTLAAAPVGKSVVLWQPGTDSPLPLTTGEALPLGAAALQWTGDGRHLAAFRGNLLAQYKPVVGMTLWDAGSGAELRSWQPPAQIVADASGDLAAADDRDNGEFDPCRGIALAPDGPRVARVWWHRAPEIWELSGL